MSKKIKIEHGENYSLYILPTIAYDGDWCGDAGKCVIRLSWLRWSAYIFISKH